MKPFELESVLKYRKQLENTAATKLASAQRMHQHAKNKYDEAHKEFIQIENELMQSQEVGIDVDELLRYQHRLSWMRSNLRELNNELQKTIKNVAKEREEVIKRSRDKKALEQLKEKQNKAYLLYMDKKESSQLDEMAVLSYDRKKNESKL